VKINLAAIIEAKSRQVHHNRCLAEIGRIFPTRRPAVYGLAACPARQYPDNTNQACRNRQAITGEI